jgi:small subunit ribosomal protein S11
MFVQKKKKMAKKPKTVLILYIKSTLRGFHINISDSSGKVLKMFSAGKLGYKKAQRYNQVSLLALVQEVLGYFQEIQSPFNVSIVLKGFSSKRNRFVRFFINFFLKKQIISITDLTDLPYNGCRPKKLRRK